MRLLVFGGWGQLGSDLAAGARDGRELLRPTHAEVDVTQEGAVADAIASSHPDAVVDAAAFHKVELCEEQPARSFSVNAVGALNVARACRQEGVRCVYVSSDYVFDGDNPAGYREDDPAGPVNVYGVSKAAGERLVRLADTESMVVRGSGLFGHAGSSGKGGNFVESMLAKAASGEAISVVDDQLFAPTSMWDMAQRIFLLLERDAPPGIYHLANAGSCSWFQFAREIFELSGIEADLSPRPTGEQQVRRPRCSVLLDTKSATLGLPPSRGWQEALRWYLESRPARLAETAGRMKP